MPRISRRLGIAPPRLIPRPLLADLPTARPALPGSSAMTGGLQPSSSRTTPIHTFKPPVFAAPASSPSSSSSSSSSPSSSTSTSTPTSTSTWTYFTSLIRPSIPATPRTSHFLPSSPLPTLGLGLGLRTQLMQVRFHTRGNTYQPHVLKRKRDHGFLSRIRTKNGRKILMRRKQKGRRFLSH